MYNKETISRGENCVNAYLKVILWVWFVGYNKNHIQENNEIKGFPFINTIELSACCQLNHESLFKKVKKIQILLFYISL